MNLKYLKAFIYIFLIALFFFPSYIFSYPFSPVEYKKPFIYPLQGKILIGFREEYFDNEKSAHYKHTGIDISGNPGEQVLAAGTGTVLYTGFSPIGGRTVVIGHNTMIRTTYLNLQSIYVSKGDSVKQGDIIASIGALDDPSCDEYHLHFGIIYNDAYLDPVQLLNIDYCSISRFLRLEYIQRSFRIY
ncbi:MAG TPA: hypothetical protein DCP02_01650 [Actinobacteria bacterium]|nr:hypothetical protein [Actinomycetota bacterium]